MRQILQFLRLLQREKIPFIAVGMSAARLHGAPVVTQDFDLWVKHIDPAVLGRIVNAVDALLSGGQEPPCAVNFTEDIPVDLVVRLSSRLSFDYALLKSPKVRIGRILIAVLPLEEIIRSKKAAGRPKDKAVLPVLQTQLRVQRRLERRIKTTKS